MKHCPQCSRTQPDMVFRCDCGHEFQERDPTRENLANNPPSGPANAWRKIGCIFLAIVCLLLLSALILIGYCAANFHIN